MNRFRTVAVPANPSMSIPPHHSRSNRPQTHFRRVRSPRHGDPGTGTVHGGRAKTCERSSTQSGFQTRRLRHPEAHSQCLSWESPPTRINNSQGDGECISSSAFGVVSLTGALRPNYNQPFQHRCCVSHMGVGAESARDKDCCKRRNAME